MDGSPRKELFVWFHEEELGQISKYKPGDRVAFYVTKKNPYPGGPAGAQSVFATGTVTEEIEAIDMTIGGKHYVFRRKVEQDLFPDTVCWIPRKQVNTLANWSEDYKYQQGCSLTQGQFERIENDFARRIDLQTQSQFFVVNQADHPISTKYEDIDGETYGFTDNVTGRNGLIEAGSRARLIFYRTGKATTNRFHYVATADVEKTSLVRPGSWRSKLDGYAVFPTPVDRNSINVDGNPQHSIRRISGEQFFKILSMGGVDDLAPGKAASTTSGIGGAIVLGDTTAPVPDRPIIGSLTPAAAGLEPLATEERQIDDNAGSSKGPRGRTNRILDKAAEERAIHITRYRLHKLGWELTRDCQKMGTGYDLEYRCGNDVALVEVKGIRGTELAFNMTAKEWATAVARRNFFVIAITKVLTDIHEIHILGQAQLFQMRRTPTQFRLLK